MFSQKAKAIFPQGIVFSGGVKVRQNKTSVKKTLDTKKIKAWLDENFENDFWENISMKCLACGACAFSCPACHCFDIVDEASFGEGTRRKNWDTCSFKNFTLHASGHNPRPAQKMRFRNRIMHKFKYYKDKFRGVYFLYSFKPYTQGLY